jgi:hypothetical protein
MHPLQNLQGRLHAGTTYMKKKHVPPPFYYIIICVTRFLVVQVHNVLCEPGHILVQLVHIYEMLIHLIYDQKYLYLKTEVVLATTTIIFEI